MEPASRFRLVIFDCDGTLVDSQHLIVEAMSRAFEARGLATPDGAAVRRIVGLSLGEAVSRLLPNGDGEAVESIAEGYKAAFAELRSRPHDEPLFPGAAAAIDRLDGAGYLLGVATGKSLHGLKLTLERHGLDRRFVTLQTGDRAAGKPDPEMVHNAMAEAGAQREETVLVGDTTFDMAMARNAEITAVGVSWGYHAVAELWQSGAHRVIDGFGELPPLLETMKGS